MIYFRCRRLSSWEEIEDCYWKMLPHVLLSFIKRLQLIVPIWHTPFMPSGQNNCRRIRMQRYLNRIPYNENDYTRNVTWLIQLCYMGIMKYVTVIHKKSLVFYKFLNRQYAFYFTNLVKKKYNALSTFGIYLQCTFTQTMFDYSYAQCSVQKT